MPPPGQNPLTGSDIVSARCQPLLAGLSRPGTAIHRPAPIRTQAWAGVKAEVDRRRSKYRIRDGLACCSIRPDHPIHSPCRIRLVRRRAGKTGASGARTSSGRTCRCRGAPPGGIARWGQWLAYLVMRFTFGLGRTKPLAAGGQASLIVVSVQPVLAPVSLSDYPPSVGSAQRGEAALALPVVATSTSGGGMANPVLTHRSGYRR